MTGNVEDVARKSNSTSAGTGPAYRDIIFERKDGSQVLVTIWTGDEPTMAERPDTSATWGPPVEAVYDSEARTR